VEKKFCDLPALSIVTLITEITQVNFLNSSSNSVLSTQIWRPYKKRDLTLRNFNNVIFLTCRLNIHFTDTQYLLVPVVHILVNIPGNTRYVAIVVTAMYYNFFQFM
jgi:hypothetical protein